MLTLGQGQRLGNWYNIFTLKHFVNFFFFFWGGGGGVGEGIKFVRGICELQLSFSGFVCFLFHCMNTKT